jgi:hypothetical protein
MQLYDGMHFNGDTFRIGIGLNAVCQAQADDAGYSRAKPALSKDRVDLVASRHGKVGRTGTRRL